MPIPSDRHARATAGLDTSGSSSGNARCARHGTSAPAFKGNVRRRSDWFIARYAQTTPMTNVATSDQSILDLRWAQESFIPPA